MRTRWFDRALDSATTIWRLERRDGVALGFTAHDRDLVIDQFRYRAAPGMLPSAIEMDDGLDDQGMEVAGALSHDLISDADLQAGRWDGARVQMGLADWSAATGSPQAAVHWIFHGELGSVEHNNGQFSAELLSAKAGLDRPFAPYSAPSCRARFCGPGCNLSEAMFTHQTLLSGVVGGGIAFDGVDGDLAARFVGGHITWIDGINAGLSAEIWRVEAAALFPIFAFPHEPSAGDRVRLAEGCDKNFATCSERFGNAANFQGEPHLPGNDLLTRYSGRV